MFHGTRAAFGVGGFVLPGDLFGIDNHGLGRSDAVYVTPDLELAKDYAEAAAGRGRPRVVEVIPYDPLTPDDSTVNGEWHESYRTPVAKVIGVAWIADPPARRKP